MAGSVHTLDGSAGCSNRRGIVMHSGGASRVTRLLICRVGTKVCGLPVEHVRETMRPLPIEPVPNLPAFVSGLAMIRGEPTPVVDARQLLGGAQAASPAQRFVTLMLQVRRAALVVDAVLGVRAVEADALRQLPGLLRGESGSGHLASLGTLDSELLLVLEHLRLVPDSAWLVLAREGAST